jgi:diguanylate cyclase (GGDEF)-like protein/PAS domain S-box-containing protein
MILYSASLSVPGFLSGLSAGGTYWLLLTLIHLVFMLAFILIYIRNCRRNKSAGKELYDANRILSSFINAESKIAYLKDENLKYLMGNQALYDFMQKDKAEIIGHDDFDFFDEHLASIRRETDYKVLETLTPQIIEYSVDGNIININKFPVKLPNGKYGVGALIDDVTEVRKHEQLQAKLLQRSSILVEVTSRDFKDRQEQLDYLLQKALELTESQYGYIYIYDEEARELTLNTWTNGVMEDCEIANPQAKYSLDKTGLWGEVIRQRKHIIINDFQKENPLKKGYPEEHVKLNRFFSIPIIIDGKIVAVAGFANKLSDYDENDVSNTIIVFGGVWQSMQRKEAQEQLAYERNKYRQTLISIGDGVMVVDKNGVIEMLNAVASELTGWTDTEARGRHYKEVFVLSSEDPQQEISDPIEKALATKTICELGNHAVLTSKSGKKYFLEDSAAPIFNEEGDCLGVVLVFRDVTQKREQRKKIEYLSYHDQLTGLYNRGFFEEELNRLDTERNYPISILMVDVNGLKLANDVFGHYYGDQLLKTLAGVFNNVCRADDIIARWGGDEFVMLLPKTSKKDAEAIARRIKDEFSSMQVKAIKGSISIGISTKTEKNQDINETLATAEEIMYSVKTLERESFSEEEIDVIMEMLHASSPEEKAHSETLCELCYKMGKFFALSEVDQRNLKELGYYHDIGKIVLPTELLGHYREFTREEMTEIRKHALVGYRILNSTDRTVNIAEAVLSHHERWDGSGYPMGLKGDEIPLLSRILAVAERYDRLKGLHGTTPDAETYIKKTLLNEAGSLFDPYVVHAFLKMLDENSMITKL